MNMHRTAVFLNEVQKYESDEKPQVKAISSIVICVDTISLYDFVSFCYVMNRDLQELWRQKQNLELSKKELFFRKTWFKATFWKRQGKTRLGIIGKIKKGILYGCGLNIPRFRAKFFVEE